MWLRMWNAKMATYTGPSSHGMHLSMYNNYMYQVTPRVFGCRMLQHEKSATSCLIGYKKKSKKITSSSFIYLLSTVLYAWSIATPFLIVFQRISREARKSSKWCSLSCFCLQGCLSSYTGFQFQCTLITCTRLPPERLAGEWYKQNNQLLPVNVIVLNNQLLPVNVIFLNNQLLPVNVIFFE